MYQPHCRRAASEDWINQFHGEQIAVDSSKRHSNFIFTFSLRQRGAVINMFASKQIATSVAVITTCVITAAISETSAPSGGFAVLAAQGPRSCGTDCNAELSCKTPDGDDGYCIHNKFCKPFNNLLERLYALEEVTEEASNHLQKFVCGYSGDQAKICCPFAPIAVETPTNIANHPNLRLLPKICGGVTYGPPIFVGEDAQLFEFPWMVLLSYDLGGGAIGFRCGGTIINERYILTAAHCITALQNFEIIAVRIGEYDIRRLRDCENIGRRDEICAPPLQNIAIEEVIPHSDYSGKSFEHDIGLIRLAKRIDLSRENAKPICLPTEKSLRNANRSLGKPTITGWGLSNSSNQSPILQKADVAVIPAETCRRVYEEKNIQITANQICAGGGTADACSGDSGGPLQKVDIFQSRNRYIQFGIVSFGPRSCVDTDIPGVYTRVASYLTWILDNMKP